MEPRGRAVPGGTATSPESAMASELFDQFVSAGTFKSVLFTYRQICDVLKLKPTNIINFYPRLKAKLHSWRAASLWTKLDKRASHKCYNRGKACPNTRVLIIGAGPCGLRAAIEAQLLGAKVVVVEKRDRFSRNNVLHLWPFVIHDLRNLGAKKFFGKFCAGSIDHISIRQLQIILLKVALLLGVEVHENVSFESLIEPPEDQTQERIGWHALVSPEDHPVSLYEFDVLIGADGKRNTLIGFNRKEFRGKLAIAVTANFINKHTIEEARVPEISGVAFIFNQKFFQDMKDQTAIDLENIVYYKDDTHYFVMTAKKQSLLERRVIIRDYNDTARLLAPENVDRAALMQYAIDAAYFATGYQLPSLDFAVNHYGQADVAMFDFTSMYAAENACRVIERRGHKLLQALVGDSLLEPFWPTGSGCARGFLSSFDAAWMIRSWASGKLSTLQVLAEREAIYRLLAQTTPENLSKDLNQYTLNPCSRYPNLNIQAVLPSQMRSLYDTDGKIEENVDAIAEVPKKRRRKESMIHPDTLLNWCQKQVALHDNIKIQDFTSSWKNGLALCTILHRYRPDLIDLSALDVENIAKNNQLAFDICERELGIPPIMTGQEMADCSVPDKLTMISYISQVYESFRGEIPALSYPKSHPGEERASSPNRQHTTPLSVLNRIRLQHKRKYSLEKEAKDRERGETVRKRNSLFAHKRKSREKACIPESKCQDVILTDYQSFPANKPRESINTRAKNLEEKFKRDAGLRCHQSEEVAKGPRTRSEQTELNIKIIQEQLQKNGNENVKKSRTPKVGKLRKDEWNAKIIEERAKQQNVLSKSPNVEKPKVHKEIFVNKLNYMDEKLRSGGVVPSEEAKFKTFDESLSKLNTRLTKGNLDVGERGHNQTAAMSEHMSSIFDKKTGKKRIPLPPAPVSKPNLETDSSASTTASETCYFCKGHVYLIARLSYEGLFFHRSCFKCEYCSASLRCGNYSFDRDGICGGKFYCPDHFRKQKPDTRTQEIMKRKEAFLSCALEEQQKEMLYKTLLDNAEKALSPNKSVVDASNSTPVKEPVTKNEKSSTPSNLLSEPPTPFGRDQTPERVEYENSILELSEEELLTSELEEEELTQKNLGPSQDLATSEDEYSDLSTDTETDEEAFAEELERSLTADETRKLAERWNKKYLTERSLIESESSSSSSSSSADDEESETEIGTDTSEDVDSDAEYSVENSEADNSSKDKEVPKPQEVKDEFTVEVPVIDLKSMNKASDDNSTLESDLSEEISHSEDNGSEEGETEVDSESEPEVPLPPPQIPTIVIHESPPQDVDMDQNWDSNETIHKASNKEPPIVEAANLPTAVSSETETPKDDLNTQAGAAGAAFPEATDFALSKEVNGKLNENNESLDFPSFRMESDGLSKIDVSNKEIQISGAPLATEESSSDLSLSSGVNSLAREIVSGVIETAKDTVLDQKSCLTKDTQNEVVALHSETSSSEDSSSEKYTQMHTSLSSEDEKVLIVDLCSPESAKPKDVSVIDLCSPSPQKPEILVDVNSARVEVDFKTVIQAPEFHENSIIPEAKHEQEKPANTTIVLDDSINLAEGNSLELVDDTLSPNSVPSFVTVRNKSKHFSDHSSDWDLDKDLSSLHLSESHSSEEMNSPKDGIYHANVVQAVDSELAEIPSSKSDEKLCKKDTIDIAIMDILPVPQKLLNSIPLAKSNEAVENDFHHELNELNAKHSTPVPKNTRLPALPLKSPLYDECKAVTNSTLSNQAVADSNKLVMQNAPNNNSNLSNLLQNEKSKKDNDNSKNETKYKGYSGSFAEKIRPKSLFCDTIYLKSLDIKLKQPFSTIAKSDDKLDEYAKVDDNGIKKRLFSDSSPSLDIDKDDVFEPFEKEIVQCHKNSNCVKSDASLEHIDKSSIKRTGQKHPSVSFSAPDSHGDLVSPYTTAQVKSDCKFPTKMRPKCDIDIGRLRQKREKRKSVHEDIQGLPFADDEKIVSPVDPLGNSEVFYTPKGNFDNNSKNTSQSSDAEVFSTPPCKTPGVVDEERFLKLQSTTEQERARQEARARARLKSDEELGLSPNNYRKKYRRQLSLNSINYDELCSDEFCDQDDDELGDEMINNFCHVKNFGIEETFNMFKNSNASKVKSSEIPASSSQVSKSDNNENLTKEFLVHPKKSLSASSDTLKSNDFHIDSTKQLPVMQTSLHSNKTSSSETSPDVICSDLTFDSKVQCKDRVKTGKTESLGEDEKSKSNGKKSLLSILNFGKGNVSKEKVKQKSKDSEKELSSSLPSDFGAKSVSKSKPFSHLKLSKSKEKTSKIKTKTPSSPLEITQAQEVPLAEPLSIQQAKIIPKYTVYRNPDSMISTFPVHLPVSKMENGLAPKASEDSFSDEEDTHGNRAGHVSNAEKTDKNLNEREKKTQRIVQKVQRQQVLKRLRNAQEIQRRLEELEVEQRQLEYHGEELEKKFRSGRQDCSGNKYESDITQEWYSLLRAKNRLMREEQELLIKLKDLELEDRQSKLHQEFKERMAQSDLKDAAQIKQERDMLTEMLEIVEKRGELVALLKQLKLKGEEEEKNISSEAFAKGLKCSVSSDEKS